jgi:hypothetical protein
VRRAVALGPLAILAIHGACKRDADAPLPPRDLFPEVQPPSEATATGDPLGRIDLESETEPNDGPELAQSLGAMAMIDGVLAVPEAVTVTQAQGKKRSKPKPVPADQDWFRLPAVAAGQVATVELRTFPPCAELALFDDTGSQKLRTARPWKGERPVLPSLGAAARGSLLRVTCVAGKGKLVQGGDYRLAVWTRPASTDEEQEDNDAPGPGLLALLPGLALQGTLAPAGDVDSAVLDLAALPPATPLQMTLTGLPDLELRLRILDGATLQPLAERQGGKGEPIVLSNLAPVRLGVRPLVQIQALQGQRADARYALALQPMMPAGCANAANCAQPLPDEREPDDQPTRPWTQSTVAARGVLDGAGDVDWVQVDPLLAKVAALQASGDVRLEVLLAGASVRLDTPMSGPLAVPPDGLRVALYPRDSKVHAPLPWTLNVAPVDAEDFEVEAGDESTSAALWTPAHALTAHREIQRTGALVPAGDVDAFGLSVGPDPVGGRVICEGDGDPGFSCALQTEAGAELARIAAQAASTELPVALQPGRYKIVVSAHPPRTSRKGYRVAWRDDPSALDLARPASATAEAAAATPSAP